MRTCVERVIRTLAERGLTSRRTEERFGLLQNGNCLGLLELISQSDPFSASRISKYENSGRENYSHVSKTIRETYSINESTSSHVHC